MSIEENTWNRKDSVPKKTIEKILGIIESIGLNIVVKESVNCDESCFSINIETSEFPGIFTNGKGITYDYAMASALGEFMERLQTGQLFHKQYFGTLLGTNTNKESFYRIYKKFFIKYIKEDNLSELYALYPLYRKMQKFYNVFSGEEQELPIELIELLCGSNGTCAGNTFYEAVTQGISELFERYSLHSIYFNKNVISCAAYSEEIIVPLESYKILKIIEEKGYKWEIKDLSLNNRIPVVGLLLWNRDRSKYSFSIGCDINVDIAIQRCITEMFQGISWNFNFRNSMRSLFEDEAYFFDNYSILTRSEYMKMLKNKTGYLPISVLIDNQKIDKIPSIFSKNISNNELAYKYVLDICKANKWDIYIRDYSFLGFPTYRVYIPSISEVAITPGDDVYNMIKISNEFKGALKNEKQYSKDMLFQLAQNFYNFPKFGNVYNLKKLLGIILDEKENEETFEKENVMYVLGGGQESDVIKWMSPFYKHPSNQNLYSNAKRIKLFLAGASPEIVNSFNDFAKKLFDDQISKEIFLSDITLWNMPCFDCSNCCFKNSCKFEEWKILYNLLIEKEKKYYEDNKSMFNKS